VLIQSLKIIISLKIIKLIQELGQKYQEKIYEEIEEKKISIYKRKKMNKFVIR